MVNPKQVTRWEEVAPAITAWEGRRNELKEVEGYELPDLLQVALMTQMCPKDVKEMIYTHSDIGT